MFRENVQLYKSFSHRYAHRYGSGIALPLSSYGVIYYQYGASCPAGSQTGAVYGRVVWCAITLDG